ncbi:MAG: GNAT family protein [Saprospiraceae bacterium]
MLVDREVNLRPLVIEDAKELAALINNKKILDNLRDVIPFPYSDQDAENFIHSHKDVSTAHVFAITYQDKFCGVIGLFRQPDVYRFTAEIGYWIGEPYWNKGIGTKAIQLITNHGFNEQNFIRIHTGIFEYNKPSMRVLEKCGYEKDGVFKKSVIKNGLMWDEHRYSKVKKD